MNGANRFIIISLAAGVLLLFVAGCANFRKAFSSESSLERSRRPVHRQEKNHARQSGERNDDPLFDMVFRKSRKEQQERRLRSELLSPQERSAMEQYHRRDSVSGDRDVQKFNREHQYKSDQRDKNWVFGF